MRPNYRGAFGASRPAEDASGLTNGATGARPPGHLRRHPHEHTSGAERVALHWVHAHVLDPDGRPDGLKRLDEV